MLEINKKAFRAHPSLLPLRMALIAAERESPAHPPRVDPDEQLAQQLIEKMKIDFAKPLPFTSWKGDSSFASFRLQEVIGTNA